MEQVFTKETKGWGSTANDFRGQDEIMVTITLHEYRELVTRDAKHAEELRKVNEAKYEAEKKATALREKLDRLLEATQEEKEEE